jgi:CheY-like chemotaxis protein
VTGEDVGGATHQGADPLVGTVLADRYRIERVIGIGGVGSVYRATQLGLDRRVAVKVLRPELTNAKNAMERFAREARTAARLQHPNIVTVHDFGTTPDGRAYLVMEFLSGLNLAQWITRRKPTDARRAAEYLAAVCRAVGTLHDSNIIHRDIKPSNIMIVDQTGGGAVKVVDFGLVRPTISDDATDLTGGLVLGTPEFMAPELFTGEKPNVSSDIYALGVTLYEAITGELPFGTGTFRDMFHRHSTLVPIRASLIRADLPAGVDELLMRAMAKNPQGRYETAAEFADAIEATFAGPAAGPSAPRHVATEIGGPVLTPLDERVTRMGSVLLVEDDAVVRDALAPALERAGFDVTAAGDGIEAFLMLGSGRFDVIVSDVQMPNLDGMTLLRLLSQKGIRTPVVLLTGTLADRDAELGRELGAVGIVAKPPDLGELLDAIWRALGVTGGGAA